ncbi:hypothetical protein ACSHT0_06380 [Tepidicaulis sp. LMO-SS28]|uniref:hypothetical protein n=1 Tax=Tepidicaulis sp. LMO-SS28 TaxID=3447455 RepID=UPI003EE3E644
MSENKRHVVIKAETGMVVLTPYAMAQISDDFFMMADTNLEKRAFPLARYYILCASIEVGLKAAILAEDCTAERKELLRQLGHDLLKIHKRFEESYPRIWDLEDASTVTKINPFFKKKGLEYFTSDVLYASAQGYKDFPPIDDVRFAAGKVNAFLKAHDLFLEGKTSQPPSGGILNIL